MTIDDMERSRLMGQLSNDIEMRMLPDVRRLLSLLDHSGLAEDDETVASALAVLGDVQKQMLDLMERAEFARLGDEQGARASLKMMNAVAGTMRPA